MTTRLKITNTDSARSTELIEVDSYCAVSLYDVLPTATNVYIAGDMVQADKDTLYRLLSAMFNRGEKVPAIKLLRSLSTVYLGLKEAKYFIETFFGSESAVFLKYTAFGSDVEHLIVCHEYEEDDLRSHLPRTLRFSYQNANGTGEYIVVLTREEQLTFLQNLAKTDAPSVKVILDNITGLSRSAIDEYLTELRNA